ncbi:MAG: V-type ATP synthase subunit D [Acutalibacteraceae bacterium]|nr:V-type ATP synthase subunit D [Acutalibacteraceae bacterium]
MAQVFPTKGNLIATKKSLELAKTGFELMDRKRNILIRETMMMIDTAKEVQKQINATYAMAYDALQKANMTLGIIDELSQAVPIDNGITLDFRSVMGVEIPMVHFKETDARVMYGYSKTNEALDDAFEKFHKVKLLTVRLAEIENSVYRLAQGIKKTQKRANALKNIIIPRFESTIKFISNSLDEKEREEFSRLKVIKKTKEV